MVATNTARPVKLIDRDTLKARVPSVFADTPWEGMSHRYKFIPTIEVIDLLADRGFLPVRAEQSRSRIPGKGDFTRHMVRMRHEDYMGPLAVGAEIPELVLTNSHDGTSAYKFEAGIYRLVCSNGMVVHSADRGAISVRHSGGNDWEEKVIDATFTVMEDAPATVEKINEWKQIELTPPQREAFAAAALELKDNKLIAPRQLLTPRRSADTGSDLWTTASVVQEHLLLGGDRGRASTGRRTTTRAVKSVSEDLRLNRALWTLTENMAALSN